MKDSSDILIMFIFIIYTNGNEINLCGHRILNNNESKYFVWKYKELVFK